VFLVLRRFKKWLTRITSPVIVIVDASKRDNEMELKLLKALNEREGLQGFLVLNKVFRLFPFSFLEI